MGRRVSATAPVSGRSHKNFTAQLIMLMATVKSALRWRVYEAAPTGPVWCLLDEKNPLMFLLEFKLEVFFFFYLAPVIFIYAN